MRWVGRSSRRGYMYTMADSHCSMAEVIIYCKAIILQFFKIIIIFFIVVDFVIHWNETAMGLHVFPILILPPTSLSTRSLWVFPVHQVRALVSCIQPGLVICFTLDNIHVSMLFSWNIPPNFKKMKQVKRNNFPLGGCIMLAIHSLPFTERFDGKYVINMFSLWTYNLLVNTLIAFTDGRVFSCGMLLA